MKIIALSTIKHDGSYYATNDVFIVKKADAERLIAIGVAEEYLASKCDKKTSDTPVEEMIEIDLDTMSEKELKILAKENKIVLKKGLNIEEIRDILEEALGE
jgi:hypothetical protein